MKKVGVFPRSDQYPGNLREIEDIKRAEKCSHCKWRHKRFLGDENIYYHSWKESNGQDYDTYTAPCDVQTKAGSEAYRRDALRRVRDKIRGHRQAPEVPQGVRRQHQDRQAPEHRQGHPAADGDPVTTFPEVQRFELFCGVLCSHLRPRHQPDEESVRWAYTKAVEMYYEKQRAVLFRRDENHAEQTWDQQREWQHNHRLLKQALRKWLAEPLGRNRVGRGTGH